jgi:hypothetical protein
VDPEVGGSSPPNRTSFSSTDSDSSTVGTFAGRHRGVQVQHAWIGVGEIAIHINT